MTIPDVPFEDTNSNSTSQDNDETSLTLRAVLSTKEAGIIIGKGGKNVAELRELTGVKAGVSKVVQGIHDRVLTMIGTEEGVAKAYSLIAQTLIDNPASPSLTSPTTTTTLRLLISHNLMGTVIGRQGTKIKHIQDISGVRMVASKTILPQSTERIVEVKGTVDAIHIAILEIGRCLMEDKERAYGTILYSPTNATHQEVHIESHDMRTQTISIPSDMVGCIIGKGGSRISEIRRLSGSKISIAKVPHDDSGERLFTIQGTSKANERALYLLYGQLELEKERRLAIATETK